MISRVLSYYDCNVSVNKDFIYLFIHSVKSLENNKSKMLVWRTDDNILYFSTEFQHCFILWLKFEEHVLWLPVICIHALHTLPSDSVK